MNRPTLGRVGEDIAERHLAKLGLSIVARNYRCTYGEIDLVALDGDELVFVEVRTRASRDFGSPEESITPAKQARMVRCALSYLSAKPPSSWRIDVVAIEFERGKVTRIDHYKNALQ